MNKLFSFRYQGEPYYVKWEESDMILTLTFLDGDEKVLKTRDVKLLGAIDEDQLDQIVKDYWRSFVKK